MIFDQDPHTFIRDLNKSIRILKKIDMLLNETITYISDIEDNEFSIAIVDERFIKIAENIRKIRELI